MRNNIRDRVFESNSSSSHTLVISDSGREPSKLIPDSEGYIHVDYGEFGKDLMMYDSQYDKLSYLVTLCYYCTYGSEKTTDTYQFKEIEDAVIKYTGCNGIIIDELVDPAIDHQSIPEYGDITIINVFDEDAVINFVFNRYIKLKTCWN